MKFHPDDKEVDAKKIALSQSVRTKHKSGDFSANDPNLDTKMIKSGKSAGYVIDVLSDTNNPLYGGDNFLSKDKDLKDTPETPVGAIKDEKSTYELGYCYKEKATDKYKKKYPAILLDKPSGENLHRR